jgi:hypothetical protein
MQSIWFDALDVLEKLKTAATTEATAGNTAELTVFSAVYSSKTAATKMH